MKKLLITLAMTLAVSNAIADDHNKSIDNTGGEYNNIGFIKVSSINGGYIVINTRHILGYYNGGNDTTVCLSRNYSDKHTVFGSTNCLPIAENIRDLDNILGFDGNHRHHDNPIETSDNRFLRLGFLKIRGGDIFNAREIVSYSGSGDTLNICLSLQSGACPIFYERIEYLNQVLGFKGDYVSDKSKIQYSGNKINRLGFIRFNSHDKSDDDLRINSNNITKYSKQTNDVRFIFPYGIGSNSVPSPYMGVETINNYFGFKDIN